MLILSRKFGESIVIDGRIQVKVVRIEGDVVKIGIEAPADVPVHRQEVYDEIQRSNRQALARPDTSLPKLPMPKANPAAGNLRSTSRNFKSTPTPSKPL